MKNIYVTMLVLCVFESNALTGSATPPLFFIPSPIHAIPEEFADEVSCQTHASNSIIVPKAMLLKIDECSRHCDITDVYQCLNRYGFIDQQGNFTELIKQIPKESRIMIIDRLIYSLYKHEYHKEVLDILRQNNFISVSDDLIFENISQIPHTFMLSWIFMVAKLTCLTFFPTLNQPKTYFDRILELFLQAHLIDEEYKLTDSVDSMQMPDFFNLLSHLIGALNEKNLFCYTVAIAKQAHLLNEQNDFINPNAVSNLAELVENIKDGIVFAVAQLSASHS